MSSKTQLRQEIAAKRKALDPVWRDKASAGIVRNLAESNAFKSASTAALYMAIEGEVDLDALFELCWSDGKRTCIPLYDKAYKLYRMVEITPQTRFETGHYGIREPIGATSVSLDDIDLIVVPGVAFDLAGNRLGRGGGYYDRFLDGFCGLSVGVAFDFQISTSIPHDQHDRPVGFIATETKFVDVRNER